MTDERFEELKKDQAAINILEFIPNVLGINICSVDDIIIKRQEDGQIQYIHVAFKPN